MKPSDTDFLPILGSILAEWFAVRWPILLVLLLGIMVSMRRRRFHLRVSKLCILGLGILLVNPVVWLILGAVCADQLRKAGLILTAGDSFVLKMFGFLECVVEAAGIGLVVAAVFADRSVAGTPTLPSTASAFSGQTGTSFREGRPTC
jgi:hypothetical protein